MVPSSALLQRCGGRLKFGLCWYSIIKIYGKAQEAVAALSLEDSLHYDSVKVAILRVYELVPEAYRQKFRNHRKGSNQTHMEFAREKGMLFAKWVTSCKAEDY